MKMQTKIKIKDCGMSFSYMFVLYNGLLSLVQIMEEGIFISEQFN